MNKYIIPANSKKSQYILGFFTMTDLIIFLTGAGITLILLMLIPSPTMGLVLLIMAPLLIAGFLVLPVPFYHNVLQFIVNIIGFYLGETKYYWKGWCSKYESENE